MESNRTTQVRIVGLGIMTGPELQAIRHKLYGTDTVGFGRAIGYQGNDPTVSAGVRRLETMARVPQWFAKLATIYSDMGKVPKRYIVEL